MKKKILFLLVLFITTGIIFLSSCSDTPKILDSPTGLIKDRRVMVWNPVENASGYKVYIDDEEYTVEECRFEMYKFDAGTYDFELQAIGDGKRFKDSDPVTQTIELSEPVTIARDQRFLYKLLDDKSGYYVIARGKKGLPPEETMTIPDFYGDYPITKLVSISNGNNTTEWSQDANYNTVTKYVKLPVHLKSIDGTAFAGMSNLREIIIPDSVTEIGIQAFANCTSLKKAVLPKGLKEIPPSCFKNTPLSEIEIPETVEIIGSSAFECETRNKENGILHISSGLSSVHIPDSVKIIGDKAFKGRERLKNIRIPKTIESIGEKAFDDTLWYLVQDEGGVYINNWLIGYKGESGALTEFEIPAGTKVSGKLFYGMTSLVKVIFNDGVLLKGNGTFKKCTSLTEVTLPKSITEIPDETFYGTTALKTIILPDSITYIGNSAFSRSGIKEINLPSELKTIDKNAFAWCESLVSINFNSKLENVRNSAFMGCTALTAAELPSSLRTLETSAFTQCSSLKFAVIPEKLETLGQQPFSGCPALEAIYFGGSSDKWFYLYDQAHMSGISANPLSNANVFYYSASAPSSPGRYWHYNNDKPAIW